MAYQFRIATFGKPRAPWRDSVDMAMKDAIRLELASWDRSKREWFLAVPVEMQRRGQRDYPDRTRPDRRGEAWSEDDIERLHKLAGAGTPASIIGIRLGRTPEAVGKKARLLGVSLPRDR